MCVHLRGKEGVESRAAAALVVGLPLFMMPTDDKRLLEHKGDLFTRGRFSLETIGMSWHTDRYGPIFEVI